MIVIITSEPRGAYHISPLYSAMKKSDIDFNYLVPYPEALQGEEWENISTSLSIVDNCDKVVLAGGGLTAWAESVLRYASNKNVPILLTELAYGNFSNIPKDIKITGISAQSEFSASKISKHCHFPLDKINITGSPQSDIVHRPGSEIILLSTSDIIKRDPELSLHKLANYFKNNKIKFRVRPHPRENKDIWSGIELSEVSELKKDLSTAKIAIAYPGSPSLVAASLGIPLINLSPNHSFDDVLEKDYKNILLNWAYNIDEVVNLLNNYVLPNRELVRYYTGDSSKSAEKIVNFWTIS